ncbi:hypothetical protein VTO73DRAFT_6068 [Trametes versicolor]
MLGRSTLRIYHPGEFVPHIPAVSATYLSPPYSVDGDPELHWRPHLSTADLTCMGLQNFGIHYSSFSFAPSQWRLVSDVPLPLGQAMDIGNRTARSRRPGIIFLQDVADLTSDGELLVYGWNLSQLQEITNYTRGFLIAADFVIAPAALQMSPLLQLLCRLPNFMARFCLRLRYRTFRAFRTSYWASG